MLIDDVYITVKAGNGGNGSSAKKQQFGSKKILPNGGNGGNGGDIYFQGDTNKFDLSEFRFKKELRAFNGVNGGHKDLDGANGEDIVIKVPMGTTIFDGETNDNLEIISTTPVLVARGGKGGIGSHDYKLNLKRITPPDRRGGEGEEKKLHLVLNLIADVGLIGLPNAGKSSLLKALTNATPKIGDYPFTTTEPNLGAIGNVIIADIPGLIEGASSGKGLGHKFLKHIKKTKVLLHCISATDTNPYDSYEVVRKEFENFDQTLLKKRELILLTKKDLVKPNELKEKELIMTGKGKEVIAVSIYEERTIKELSRYIGEFLGIIDNEL